MPDDAIERAAVEIATRMVPGRFGDDGKRYMSLRQADDWTVAKRAALLAFASQQAPEGWAIALHLSKQEDGACITSIVLSVHNGTSEADALKRAIDYAAVEKPGFAVEQYLAQKYPPAMLDAAPSVTLGEVG